MTVPSASINSFPPTIAPSSRVLVLGTMPGVRSLAAGEYYAHPRNVFWRLMDDILGVGAALPYTERIGRLTASGVGLWDVVASCERDGSLDADIRKAEPNDFAAVLPRFPSLGAILFNGRKAADLWQRLVRSHPPGLALRTLPSSSPANARLTYDERRRAWADALGEQGIIPEARL